MADSNGTSPPGFAKPASELRKANTQDVIGGLPQLTPPKQLDPSGGATDNVLAHDGAKVAFASHVNLQPDEDKPAVKVAHHSGGKHTDFGGGAPGIIPNWFDPPSPDWIDDFRIESGASMVYANDVLLDPIPFMLKITSSSGAVAQANWSALTSPTMTEHYGRCYIYMDTLNTSAIRLAEYFTPSGSRAGIVSLSSAHKVTAADAAQATQATSTTVLAATTHYRLEWHFVHSATVGSITISIYKGHETDPIEIIRATNINNAANTGAVSFGSANNNNLGGNYIRLGAFAAFATAPVGPYSGRPAIFRVNSEDGTMSPLEITPSGDLVIRALDDYTYGGGGNHYRVQAGDQVARIDNRGNMMVGLNPLLGDPRNSNQIQFPDTYLNASDFRPAFQSLNLLQISDPPDLCFIRAVDTEPPGGTGASTTAGSSTVTISDITLNTLHRGSSIVIDGNVYNITEITSATTVTVDPTPAGNGAGLTWTVPAYPHISENLQGLSRDSASGQVRWEPIAFAFIRAGTAAAGKGISTTAGSADITLSNVGDIDANDIGRFILINSDPTLAERSGAHSVDCFKITAVAGLTVTLDHTVIDTLANKNWALSAGINEAGGHLTATNNGTLGAKLAGDARFWSAGGSHTAPLDMYMTLFENTLYTGASSGINAQVWYHDGTVTIPGGLKNRWQQQSVSTNTTLVALSTTTPANDLAATRVAVDSSLGVVTVTLPAAPTTGSFFNIFDTAGSAATNNITIARNGKNIDGAASNLTLTANYGGVDLYYDGTGWHSTPNSPRIAGIYAPLASPTLTGTTSIEAMKLKSIAPAQITSNQNNYNPTGLSTASVMYINSDAARDVTGVAGGAGDKAMWIYNTGSFTITLKHATTSSAGNQFFGFGGLDYALASNHGVFAHHNGTYWVLMSE
jgi:hypothetical protein